MSRIPGGAQLEAIDPIHGIFYASQSDIVRLGRRIGTGAEGEVYEIQDSGDLVAKIYHEPPTPEKAEKLIALSRLGNERLFNLSAWPVSALRDAPDGEVAGFMMKKIIEAEEVHTLHSPRSRLQKFPEASWAFLIYVAANIARAVALMHEHGLIIGDVNPKNILVTRKATVYLLDVDSFQFTAEGKTYRCEGGFPEYTPPELQGVAFRKVDRNREHDCFGLAVVIFQLLFMGRHPYSGMYLGAGEMPLERAIRESRFAYGADAEARGMRQPPGALALDSMPSLIVKLFRRAFLSTDRPGPREWVELLNALSKSLKKCDMHSGHQYYRELSDCPWCEIETNARVRLFNITLPGDDSRHGSFRLDEIWKDIENAKRPDAPLIPWEKILKEPELSPEIAKLAAIKDTRFTIAVVFSAAIGPVIHYISASTFPLVKLIIAGMIARAIASVEPSSLELIQARLQRARESANGLQAQYDREAGNEIWDTKKNELRKKKVNYENLAQIRKFKVQQLEAEARKNQLDEFLDQFKIDDSEIRGVVAPIKAVLQSHGVETAADVIEELEEIPSVGRFQAQTLFEWRRALEQKFVFDPAKAVPREVRIKTEKEVDTLRLGLESELVGGGQRLRRMKQEIEAHRRKLQPAMKLARQELVNAKKDLEIARKDNSLMLILIVLIISFFIGWAMEL